MSLAQLQEALGGAVLHFLWQGTLIALLARLVLATLSTARPTERYAVAVLGLAASFVAFGVTLAIGWPSADDLALDALLAGALGAAEVAQETSAGFAIGLDQVLAGLWSLGALWMALRFLRGAFWARGLRTEATVPADGVWQRMLDDLRDDLGLRRPVRLGISEEVDGPVVVGWFAPMVLVPLSTLTGLTPEMVRVVLAHELAHIRRHDPLVNALQALVEVSLFFHPATWWLSRVVRAEREHCCDAVAVRACQRPKLFAEALHRLESFRLNNPSAALAAKAHGGPLMQRIVRILDTDPVATTRTPGLCLRGALGAMALALGVGVAQAAVLPAAAESAAATFLTGDPDEDYALIESHLRDAVAMGRMSFEDAARTMRILSETMPEAARSRDAGERRGADARRGREQDEGAQRDRDEMARRRYEEIGVELRRRVRAGEITREQAEERMEALGRRLRQRATDGRRGRGSEEPALKERQRRLEEALVESESRYRSMLAEEEGANEWREWPDSGGQERLELKRELEQRMRELAELKRELGRAGSDSMYRWALEEEKKKWADEGAEKRKKRDSESLRRKKAEAEGKKRKNAEGLRRKKAEALRRKNAEAEGKKREESDAESLWPKKAEAEGKKRKNAEGLRRKKAEAEGKKRKAAEAEPGLRRRKEGASGDRALLEGEVDSLIEWLESSKGDERRP